MKNLDRIVNVIGYVDDDLYEKLELVEARIEKSKHVMCFIFHGKEMVSPKIFFEFTKELEIFKKKLPNIDEINYQVIYDSTNQKLIMDYFNYIVNEISLDNPRFLCVHNYEKHYDDNTNQIVVTVASDDGFMMVNKKEIQDILIKSGINSEIIVRQNENESISHQIFRENDRFTLEEMKKMQNEVKYDYLYANRELNGLPVKIKDIPITNYDFQEFKAKYDKANFYIEGTIVVIESKTIDKNSKRYNMIIYDGTDSIQCQKRARTKEEVEFMDQLKVGYKVKMQAYADYNEFYNEVVLTVTNMSFAPTPFKRDERLDNMSEKRVELHLHTKMSSQDGVNDMADYVERAIAWGHKAIAVTDHGSVQAFPDLFHLTEPPKGSTTPPIKPIYGLEITFVDDDSIYITRNEKDILLSEATYVVFDIETTGLSVNFEKIIEIGAVKIKAGQVIDEFSTFINPKQPISETTSRLTHIFDSDVKEADTEDIVLRKFAKFIEGTILVGHNASFDVDHIIESFKRNNIPYGNNPTIDTLVLAKVLYPDRDRYGLATLSKMLKVELSQHHRAVYDAKATSEIFLHEIAKLKELGIKKHNHINLMIDKKKSFKYPYPNHINLLVKTDKGLYNLFKLLSDASTTYFYKEPKLLKSQLLKNHEGILVGTGCRNSYFFEIALNKSEEDLRKIITFYDYIELQPLSSFEYYKESMSNYKYQLQTTYKKIIRLAKEYGILVVATGDVHQLKKEDTIYREVLVQSPIVGGGKHYLSGSVVPSEYFMTTEEMLAQFDFLGDNLAYEIVVTNTNILADNIEYVKAFKPSMYAPTDDFLSSRGIPSIERKVEAMVKERAEKLYGDLLPGIVKDRLDKEMNAIKLYKYSTIYFISHLLVKKSNDDGYLVGSRGSVGSSIVATFLDITEVNPLPPHYVCPKCRFSSFKMTEEEKRRYGVKSDEIKLQTILDTVESGFDLPDEYCPVCGELLRRDGHDIPFETFLGFKGDKVPDIDLNFSGEYQGVVHNYIRELFGNNYAFRAGTIGTCAAKTAFAMVTDYVNLKNEKLIKEGLEPITLRRAEKERLAMQIEGSKRTSGQHPGGIVVVPNNHQIYEVTPVQYPGDSKDTSWRTTHFDYHSFENNLFKLDVLGHDDPTVIKYLMTFVEKDPLDFPFTKAKDIPVNDKNVYQLLSSTDIIGIKKEEINSEVVSFGVPEFGTDFVRGMLTETKPQTFAELVKISGLSHGTDVWFSNAQDLVSGKNKELPKIDFKDIIGCRDDIMVDLISYGMPNNIAFEIMEFVRKGKALKDKAKWEKYAEIMNEYKIPKWYIWSCSKIQYMFPKAHATAYVIMAMRIAWFKLYRPIYFYSAYLSKRAVSFDVDAFMGGKDGIIRKIEEIQEKGKLATEKESDLVTVLQIALEMHLRGFSFKPIDIEKSEAKDFMVSEDKKSLILPFIVLDSLGDSGAFSIVNARNERPFLTKEDFKQRAKVSTKIFEKLDSLGAFKDLPEDSQIRFDLEF